MGCWRFEAAEAAGKYRTSGGATSGGKSVSYPVKTLLPFAKAGRRRWVWQLLERANCHY